MQPYNANISYVFGEYQRKIIPPRWVVLNHLWQTSFSYSENWHGMLYLRIPLIWVGFESGMHGIHETEEIPITHHLLPPVSQNRGGRVCYFLYFTENEALKELWKMIFISPKNPPAVLEIFVFCNFPPFLPTCIRTSRGSWK